MSSTKRNYMHGVDAEVYRAVVRVRARRDGWAMAEGAEEDRVYGPFATVGPARAAVTTVRNECTVKEWRDPFLEVISSRIEKSKPDWGPVDG